MFEHEGVTAPHLIDDAELYGDEMRGDEFYSGDLYSGDLYSGDLYSGDLYSGDLSGDSEPADGRVPFDDSDGAYAVAEPDPFAEPVPIPLRRPSLRAELGGRPAVPVTSLPRRSLPSLPVPGGLSRLLPDGLRRGSTIAVTSSVSLLLALLGGPSAHGAWIAMVGMPAISAEAAEEAGITLSRLAIISPPDAGGWTGSAWATAVGALLDAVDIVVARPGFGPAIPAATAATPAASPADRARGARGTGAAGGVSDGDARRLTARARNKDAVLVLFGQRATGWPAVELKLAAQHGDWTGIGDGYGRLTQRRLLVSATGKGAFARPRTSELWL